MNEAVKFINLIFLDRLVKSLNKTAFSVLTFPHDCVVAGKSRHIILETTGKEWSAKWINKKRTFFGRGNGAAAAIYDLEISILESPESYIN